ncbi:MAG: hypothetical protein DRI90_20250 [Deltaproteobacteria bacterium]|nr:MAG: hypothetical protein DRI90_20250 [Deltaproteobacteria bacterium]
MATVFLARLPGVGGFRRLVAIKRLHPHLAHEQEFVEMFLDEARLAASIHHRNVVPILEIGTSVGGYYLVMEYIEGVTLARLMAQAVLKKLPVPRPVLLRIVLDTLTGLYAAHELTDDDGESLGVVHRDCSPQNILIGLDGCTRITDFGVARASSRLHTTREGAMKGKLAYMAPEQTGGDDFDKRADLFSVTVVLWEALSSRRLFRGKTEAQTLRRLIHEPIPRLRDVVPNIHPALDELCHKGLKRDPGERFQTAEEMADELEAKAREAMGSEAVATERAVEGFMRERYSTSVSSQREALRAWFQATPTVVSEEPRTTVRGIGKVDPNLLVTARERALSSEEAEQPKQAKQADRAGRSASGDEGVKLPASDDDETHIYESSTPSAVTSEWVDEPMVPEVAATQRSTDLSERRHGGRWLIAALVLGALAAAFIVIRPDQGPSSEVDTAASDTGAASGTSAGPTTSTAAHVAPDPPASSESVPLAVSSAQGSDRPPPGRSSASVSPPATRSVPRPTASGPPSSTKGQAPPTATTSAAGGMDDLSNPYR